MTTFVIRRILWIIPVLFAVSIITFLVMHAAPGGPWDRERKIPDAVRLNIERKYGLDKPLWRQYVDYMAGAIHGDLGPSFRDPSRSIDEKIRAGLPATFQLGMMALVFAIVVGVSLGVIAALRQNSWIDYLSMFFAMFGYSIPNFVLAVILVVVFTASLHWLPSSGWGSWQKWLMPALALGVGPAAILARYTRSSMLDVIRQDYVRTAEAKGLKKRGIVSRHMLKNAILPVVTILGPITANLVTGSFVIERMFRIPGIGQYFVAGTMERDYPMIMGTTLFYAGVVAVMNLLVDMLYLVVDPRIRYN